MNSPVAMALAHNEWSGMWSEVVLKVVRVYVWVHFRSIVGSIVGAVLKLFDTITVNPPGHRFGRQWWSRSEALSPLELPPL